VIKPRPAPASDTSWTVMVATVPPARAAFATLDVAERQLLEAVLFDGYTATELADSLGIAAMDIRQGLGAAMLALAALLVDEPSDPTAVTAMLALHALDALDADEAALVNAILAHQPALRRAHGAYCELVGELCLAVSPAELPPGGVERLCSAIDADLSAN